MQYITIVVLYWFHVLLNLVKEHGKALLYPHFTLNHVQSRMG